MKTISFSSVEVLPSLLDKSKVQTIRPLWKNIPQFEVLIYMGNHEVLGEYGKHFILKKPRFEKGEKAKDVLKGLDGIIIPGGFGDRGWEGKIAVAEYARKNDLPFLGICLGFQAAVVEYARNVAGLEANSTEMDPKVKDKVISLMDEQKEITDKGGTMRLGAYDAVLEKGSIVAKLYKSTKVSERHRHRYEVNPEYHSLFKKTGLKTSGFSPDGKLAEFLELPKHTYFVATQAHPELKSKLEAPAPLFYGLVKAAKDKRGW